MRENGLSKARRAWIATLLVGATFLAGYGCLLCWPDTSFTIDPTKTPFYGPYQASGFLHPSPIHDTQGLRRAHKLIVAATVLVALLGSLRWWDTSLVRRGLSLVTALVEKRRRMRRVIGGLVLIALLAVLLANEMPSLGKTPDFTSCSSQQNVIDEHAHRNDSGARGPTSGWRRSFPRDHAGVWSACSRLARHLRAAVRVDHSGRSHPLAHRHRDPLLDHRRLLFLDMVTWTLDFLPVARTADARVLLVHVPWSDSS